MANIYLNFVDLIVAPLYLLLFYFAGNSIKRRNIEANPSYKYYIPGLMVKLFGGIAICLVYVFYYAGGDTTNYYLDGLAITRAFLIAPLQMLKLTFIRLDAEVWYSFSDATGWLIYSYDPYALFVDRITWIFCFLSFGSFIGQTMLLVFVCYQAVWRLYQMLIYEFPDLKRQMAFSVLFIPSVVFWGSGLLKDSITFAAVSLFASSLHHLIKIRKKNIRNIFFILIASILLLRIKPYIFFALLPGSVLWTVGFFVRNVKNKIVRVSITPIFILIAIASGYMMLVIMGNSLGDYRIDNVLNKAVTTQQDLKQDYYRGSSFDIGDFDPTVTGILGKAPIAIVTALFRPYIWESYNPAMYASGVENLVLLVLTIYLLWKLRFYNLFRLMFRHHFLFFSISFSIFFAFSIGLTTSNFGSLVRYKIPAIPFFVASLFIMAHTYSELTNKSSAVENKMNPS